MPHKRELVAAAAQRNYARQVEHEEQHLAVAEEGRLDHGRVGERVCVGDGMYSVPHRQFLVRAHGAVRHRVAELAVLKAVGVPVDERLVVRVVDDAVHARLGAVRRVLDEGG